MNTVSHTFSVNHAGDSKNRPLVMIHGWGGSSRYFVATHAALTNTCWCIAPDLPGYGVTPPLADPAQYTHRHLAGRLMDLTRHLGLAEFDILGHSYGAGVAIHLAALSNQPGQRVVLSNFSTFRSEQERRFIDRMHGFMGWMVAARRWPVSRGRLARQFFASRFFHRPPADDVLTDGLDTFHQMDATAAEASARQGLGWDTPNTLASLSQPVLLIHSRHDQIMPARNAEFTIGLAKRGTLVWLNDTGHLPMLEQPERWAGVVTSFLRSA
jgi:pimeloyl-ACP methyl ester carboxylesterase